MKLFLSPHNDDETLFGAFTIMRERPVVCVVFDSYVQPARGVPGCSVEMRREETFRAIQELNGKGLWFIGLRDDQICTKEALVIELAERFPLAEQVWAPAFAINGHDQHNLVAEAADVVFPGKVTHYQTYTSYGKSRNGAEVLPRSGEDIARKLRALACYRSQLAMDARLGCWPHFMNDLREYVLP